MKNHHVSLAALLIATCLCFSGCGQKETAPSSPAETPGVKTYAITGGDNMKFNLTEITAAPGEEIKVVFTNIGTQPKNAMGHNWVLLKKGSDPAAFANAALQAQATEYFPENKKDEVVARTKLLGAGETDAITFKAPTEPGDYPFLCTFPAHYQVGMKGVLTIK